jgi:hypothetical protein
MHKMQFSALLIRLLTVRLAQLRVGDFNNFVLSETMEDIL